MMLRKKAEQRMAQRYKLSLLSSCGGAVHVLLVMAGQKTSSLQRLHQEIRTAWLGTSSSGDLPQPEQIEKEKVY